MQYKIWYNRIIKKGEMEMMRKKKRIKKWDYTSIE